MPVEKQKARELAASRAQVLTPGQMLRELGRPPVPVPAFLLRAFVERAFASRLTSFPPEELDHIQYLCAVDGSRAVRDLGWSASHTLRETIRSVLAPA